MKNSWVIYGNSCASQTIISLLSINMNYHELPMNYSEIIKCMYMNMKKRYMKPAMQVVKIQQHCIICTSPGVKTFGTSPEGFTLIDLDEDDV